jgi:hypothetical protein
MVRHPCAEGNSLAISTEMLDHFPEFANNRRRNDENLLVASDKRPRTSQSPMASDYGFFVARQERTKDQQLTSGRFGRQRSGTTKNHMSKRPADMSNILPRERVMGHFIGRLAIDGGQQHQTKEVCIIIHGKWRNIRIIRGVAVVISVGSFWVDVG